MTDFADAFDGLLARFDPAVDALARQLVAMLTEVRPDLTGKVRIGWGSVNFRHPEAGYVCAVLPQANDVALVFAHGRLLDHPLLIDDGKVKQVRWMRFRPGADIPVDDIAILLAEAIALRA